MSGRGAYGRGMAVSVLVGLLIWVLAIWIWGKLKHG